MYIPISFSIFSFFLVVFLPLAVITCIDKVKHVSFGKPVVRGYRRYRYRFAQKDWVVFMFLSCCFPPYLYNLPPILFFSVLFFFPYFPSTMGLIFVLICANLRHRSTLLTAVTIPRDQNQIISSFLPYTSLPVCLCSAGSILMLLRSPFLGSYEVILLFCGSFEFLQLLQFLILWPRTNCGDTDAWDAETDITVNKMRDASY